MSLLFGNGAPGCFYKRKIHGGVSGAKFNFVSGGSELSIVQSFSVTQSDDYAAMKCLGDVAYINSFGKSPVAQITVTLLLFLIKNSSDSGIFNRVKSSFRQKRLSAVAGGGGSEPCALTAGTSKLVTCYPVSSTMRASSEPIGVGYADIVGVSLKDR